VFLHAFRYGIPTDGVLDEICRNGESPQFFIAIAQVCHDGITSGLWRLKTSPRDSVTKDLQELGKAAAKAAAQGQEVEVETLSTLFRIQILVDNHEILGDKVGEPANRMHISMNVLKSFPLSFSRLLQSGDIPPTMQAHGPWEESCGGPTKAVDRVLDFPWARQKDWRISQLPALNRPSTKLMTPSPLYSQNPVLCGLTILEVYLSHQDIALWSVDLWWSIIPVAHIYNALKQNDFLQLEWKSMEDVITTYTPEYTSWLRYRSFEYILAPFHHNVRL
jgi:hypothetical protein